MRIRADFSQREVVLPKAHQWVDSPTAGVERMMLDRIGDEVAQATSLVRYQAESHFPAHTHSGGEEILVLEGTFEDEHGVYPAGSYLRNPIGTAHAPKIGKDGALIFVKLHQFSAEDTQTVNICQYKSEWRQGLVKGLKVLPLHEFGSERVALVKWAPHTQFQPHTHWGGEEILVLEGCFYDEHGVYPKGSWIRSPHQSSHCPYTKEDGSLIYVKTGHLVS